MICSVKLKMFLGKNGMRVEDCNRVSIIEVLTWPPNINVSNYEQNLTNVPSSNGEAHETDIKSTANNKSEEDVKLRPSGNSYDVELLSDTNSNPVSLTEVELALENECANFGVSFYRPFSTVAAFSSTFVSFCTLDMSAVGFDTWKDFIWMPILSMIMPFVAMYYISYSIRKELNDGKQTHDDQMGVELSEQSTAQSNPLHRSEVEPS